MNPTASLYNNRLQLHAAIEMACMDLAGKRLGVRACDIAAMSIHDDVLASGPYIDEDYADRRGKAFIVAVECARPASTCFCVSMGTGPEVSTGFDVALIELDDGREIESVLITKDNRVTFCISTQAGCAMGCRFCATAQLGLQRNLTSGEIIAQVQLLLGLAPPGRDRRNPGGVLPRVPHWPRPDRRIHTQAPLDR